jgi:hypothetical protein
MVVAGFTLCIWVCRNIEIQCSPVWWNPGEMHCDQVVHLDLSFVHSLLEDLPCVALLDPAIALLSILQPGRTNKSNEGSTDSLGHASWSKMVSQTLGKKSRVQGISLATILLTTAMALGYHHM